MTTIVEATNTLDTINKRLTMALPLIESAQLLMEMAPEFVALGNYELATSSLTTASEIMELAHEILKGN